MKIFIFLALFGKLFSRKMIIVLFSFRPEIGQRNETQNERREKKTEKRAKTKSTVRTLSISVS